MLIVLGGRPGTGKTTVGKALAERCAAAYLRVDVIEQALRQSGIANVGASGYAAAQAIARSNLERGLMVVADSVNSVAASRRGWRAAARDAGQAVLDVELICSDVAEHRRRIESRVADIAGLVLPTWASVLVHPYEPRSEPRLLLDTALLSPAACVDAIVAAAGSLADKAPAFLPGAVPR